MDIFVDIVAKFPWIITVLAVIGGLRVVFKPLQLAIDQIVEQTETTKDNEIWNSIKNNFLYKALVWLVDFAASIKLPK